MTARLVCTILVGLASVFPSLFATTVQPPKPNELINGAEWIATGRVTNIHSEWRNNSAGRHLYTIVEFQLEDRWVGSPDNTVQLVFLGGEKDGKRLDIVGQPKFDIGDTELLFVAKNGKQLCPIVRMGYGRFSLSGNSRLLREDHSRLISFEQVSTPLHGGHDLAVKAPERNTSSETDGLTLGQFRQIVTSRALTLGRKDVHLAPSEDK